MKRDVSTGFGHSRYAAFHQPFSVPMPKFILKGENYHDQR